MSDQPFDQTAPRNEGGTTEVAKDEAGSVAQDVRDGAGQVAQTAKDEARYVASEATSQVRSLYSQVTDDLSGQARDQQQRAAGGLHALAAEFTQMADRSEDSGMAGGLVQQAAGSLDGVASWLEDREPRDLLDDVRRYARRNPGTFLGICALVGLVGGRLTRSLREEARESQQGYEVGQPGPSSYVPQTQDAGLYVPSTGQATPLAAAGTAPQGGLQTEPVPDPGAAAGTAYAEPLAGVRSTEETFLDQDGEPR